MERAATAIIAIQDIQNITQLSFATAMNYLKQKYIRYRNHMDQPQLQRPKHPRKSEGKEEAINSIELSEPSSGLTTTLLYTHPRSYIEQLATSQDDSRNWQTQARPLAPRTGEGVTTTSLIVKSTDSQTSTNEIKKLIMESMDPKALKVGVNKMKSLANNSLLVECKYKTDCDTLEEELNKIKTLTTEHPKKYLPTSLLVYVLKSIEDSEIKDIILLQNNLSHIEEPVLNVKFTKKIFKDSRHIVIEVSPNLRKAMVPMQKIKMRSKCKIENFIVVTRCFKCLGFGYTSKYCRRNEQQPYLA
ncbi:hypothetical protein C0J52_21741 [Blattella germanica]|nr:hypothetical protein C0J52_21741 [Blattella germanica]